MSKYLPTIGLEIHVELNTKTKMFCSCLNDPEEKHPNINICPVCTGQPGALPVANEKAIEAVLKLGMALNSEIPTDSKFDRKNYFYPDLPKGYQISQFDKPLVAKGELNGIRITRIHLEEDTARLAHSSQMPNYPKDKPAASLVDFNRAGVPLMELVTEPDIKSADEAVKFAKELQLILRHLDISNADMEKGQLRIEVNISLRPEFPISNSQFSNGALGTKVEIKNLNSFRVVGDAINYEIERQSELLEKGEEVVQETRGWDDIKKRTVSQRLKEESHDYRYFPEPDLPPLDLNPQAGEFDLEKLRIEIPELPAAKRERFKKEYGITDAQIEAFIAAKQFGDYYECVASEIDAWANIKHQGMTESEIEKEAHIPGKLHTLAANYLITEFPPLVSASGLNMDEIQNLKVSPESFAGLMVKIFHQELSSTGAKAVLKEMFETGLTPEEIIKNKDLKQISREDELKPILEEIIKENPEAIANYKKGKENALQFLIGQAMARLKGKGNPEVLRKLLKELIS